MVNLLSEQQSGKAAIARKIRRTVLVLMNNLILATLAMMPFLLIEDQGKPEFWQSVGYYGVFLIGLSALVGRSGRCCRK